MANWTKLSDGTWGVRTKTGRAGQTVTVTRANGTSSEVTLGVLVNSTRWGQTFTVAGRKAPAKAAPVARRRPARRRRRVNPGVANHAGIVAGLRAEVAATKAREAAAAVAVADDDPSVARFLLLNLDDDVTTVVADDDDGGARLLQID